MEGVTIAASIIPPNLEPAVSPKVHLSLTIVYTSLYGLLFLMIYVQLWMILYYRHRRLSHQTVFLSLCLLWAGLRTTLFSFYFRNTLLANSLEVFPYWLLYCFPVCLQFITLCLLVHFFSRVVIKARAKYEPNKYRLPLLLGLGLAVVVFLTTNVVCAVIIKSNELAGQSPPSGISLVRVLTNDLLFIICAIALTYFLYKMSKMPSADLVLEARGTTKCRSVVACVLIMLLYVTRALYNIIAISQPIQKMLSFGYEWINVSDQAENGIVSTNYAYVSFGIVLFVWEFLPTFIVVVYFRVQRPPHSEEQRVLNGIANSKYNTRAYFFDNPRRYDSDEDIARSFNSRSSVFESGSGPFTVNHESTSVPNVSGSSSHGLPGSPPAFFTASGSLPPPPSGNPVDDTFYDGT